MDEKAEDAVCGAEDRAMENFTEEDIAENTGDSAAEDAAEDEMAAGGAVVDRQAAEGEKKPIKKKPGPKKPGKKKLALILAASLLALGVLFAGGYGIWRLAAVPKEPVNLDDLTPGDVGALYREKSKRGSEIPAGLETLLGTPDDSRLVPNGSGTGTVTAPAQSAEGGGRVLFLDQEWLLTDRETHALLAAEQETDIIRELQVRALIKLALTQNCEKVRYSVEYIELPEGGEYDSIAAYAAAHRGGVQGQGGFTYEFSAAWASRTIGRDIKSVADTRADFDAFIKELETYEPVESLIVPGVGR